MAFTYLPGQVTQRELARVVEDLELNELKQSADRARAHKDLSSLGVFAAELGRRYKNGVGVPADPRTSFTWFSESATAGLMSSQFGVGCMYLDEGGRPFTGQGPDFEKALHWIRLSAAQGFPDAVETLAGLRHHLRAEKVRRVFTSGIPLDRGRIVGDIPNAVAKDYGFPHCEIIPHDGTVTVVLSLEAGNGPRFMFTVEDGVLQAGADQQVVIVPDYPSRKWWELVRAQEKNDKASIDSHIDYFDALLDKLLAAPSHALAAKMPGRPTQTRPVSEHDRAPPRPSPPFADSPRKRKRKRRPRVWSKSLVAPLLGAIAFGVVASSRTDFGISVFGLLDALHLLHRTDTTAFTGGKPRYVDNSQSYRSEALAFPSLGIATSVVFRQLPSSEWGTTWKVVPGSIGAGVLVDAYSARYHDVLLTCAPVGSKSSTSYQMQFLTVTSEPDEDTLLAIPGVVSSCAQRLVVGPGQTPQVLLRHPDATATIASYQGSSVYMEEQVDWGARQSAVCSQLLELLPDEIDRHQLCGFDLQSVARELSEEWRPNLAHWCFTYSDRLNDAHIPGWHYDPSSAMIDPLTEKARSAARRARRVQILSADFKAHVCQPAVAAGR